MQPFIELHDDRPQYCLSQAEPERSDGRPFEARPVAVAGGRVVLSALNTFVELGGSRRYDLDEDPLRPVMRRMANEMGIDTVHLRAPFPRVMPDDIETGFEAAGFQLDSFKCYAGG